MSAEMECFDCGSTDAKEFTVHDRADRPLRRPYCGYCYLIESSEWLMEQARGSISRLPSRFSDPVAHVRNILSGLAQDLTEIVDEVVPKTAVIK